MCVGQVCAEGVVGSIEVMTRAFVQDNPLARWSRCEDGALNIGATSTASNWITFRIPVDDAVDVRPGIRCLSPRASTAPRSFESPAARRRIEALFRIARSANRSACC